VNIGGQSKGKTEEERNIGHQYSSRRLHQEMNRSGKSGRLLIGWKRCMLNGAGGADKGRKRGLKGIIWGATIPCLHHNFTRLGDLGRTGKGTEKVGKGRG